MFKINKKTLNSIIAKSQAVDPSGALSASYYEEQLAGQDYVVYATGVAAPISDVEPGAVVPCEYDGMRAKWLNGTIYIRRVILEQKQNKSP